ncbi:MAG: SAM-dependent methyltransferase [Alcaligenaceae bacterium]|nr:MAG: SAM-dependent methyltransferase [Alcaligenaceae bacterium]
MIDNRREYEVMAEVETNHWWYRILHSLVLESIERELMSPNIHVLDAGCGTGGLIHSLKAAGYRQVKGFDLSPIAVDICQKKGLDVQLGSLNDIATIQAPSKFDVIISNDTLYYLSADQQLAFLKNANTRLNRGGLILMNMPALAAFRGTHDRAVGILHRFNRLEVKELIQSAGFEALTLRYWPLSLSPAIFVVRAWQRLKYDPASLIKPLSDLKSHSVLLNTLLYRLIRLEIRLARNTPFGSSLFTVLRRT